MKITRREFAITAGLSATGLVTGSSRSSELIREPGHVKYSNKEFLSIWIDEKVVTRVRPNGSTDIVIEWKPWPGNKFRLWLPEAIRINNKVARDSLWGNWMKEDQLQQWSNKQPNKWIWQRDFGIIDFISEIVVDELNSCLWLSNIFTNKSQETIRNSTAQVCFQLGDAPQFVSIDRKRYWACIDGTWISLSKPVEQAGVDPTRISFTGVSDKRPKEVNILHNPLFTHATMPQQSHSPLIISESFSGRASVGIAFSDCSSIFNNNEPNLRCLHSDSKPIPVLNPGETKKQEGLIIYCQGGHEELVENFNRIVGESWAS